MEDSKNVDDVEEQGESEEEDVGDEDKLKLKEKARDTFEQAGGLQSVGSAFNLLDLSTELNKNQQEILKKVRKSVHIAKSGAQNLRLASSEDGETGMKMVDIGALLDLIQEDSLKQQVQQEAAKSKRMVDSISKLLVTEGFL